jgi:circadian clock protein KaiC
MTDTAEFLPKASTGVAGLDDVLKGGLARNRLHLLEGSPGTGKTTTALQFLLAGADQGEIGIYVSLAETEQELRDGARSHGWLLDDKIRNSTRAFFIPPIWSLAKRFSESSMRSPL